MWLSPVVERMHAQALKLHAVALSCFNEVNKGVYLSNLKGTWSYMKIWGRNKIMEIAESIQQPYVLCVCTINCFGVNWQDLLIHPTTGAGIPCFVSALDFLVEIIRNPLWFSSAGCWTGVFVSSPSSESWSVQGKKVSLFSYVVGIQSDFLCLCSPYNVTSAHS